MQDHSSSKAESNASAALLMLDIASAKSTLVQLQDAFAAASEEHTRTKTALLSLQHLDNHSPKYPLEGLKTPLGSRTAAQQLQALHTENLHLKACLKEEVQARQRLEKKHGELLDLLRSGRVLELLASGFVPSTTAPTASLPSEQQHWPSSTEVYRRITADAVHGPDQLAAARGAAATSDATSNGTQQQPGRTASSSSSYTSSTAGGGNSPHAWQHKGSTPQFAPESRAGAQPRPQHTGSGLSAHSAYFPAQAQQQQQPLRRADGHSTDTSEGPDGAQYSRHAAGAAGGRGAAAAAAAARPGPPAASLSSPSAAAPATWQDSMQQGLFNKLAQQGSSGSQGHGSTPAGAALYEQLQQCSTPPGSTQQQLQDRVQDLLMRTAEGGQRPQASPAINFSTGYEVAEGLLSHSTSSSSSQSAQSELLDSDDLDELAGLCDTLLQHHTAQPMHHTPSAAAGAGALHTPQQQQQQRRQQQTQQGLAGTAWFAAAEPGEAAGGCFQQQCQQHSPAGAPADAAGQACAPGLQALAAQLQLLQEQVTATAMDAAPVRASSGSGACGTPATQGVPGGSSWGSDHGSMLQQQSARHASAAGSASQQQQQQHPSSRASEQRRRSTGSTGTGPGPQQQQGQAGLCEGPPLASLQQQLAQRMQEVKERLSNICNGMLQDGQLPAAPGMPSSSNTQSSNSFFSPPASPPAEHSGAASHSRQHQGHTSTSKPFAGSSTGGAQPAAGGKLAAAHHAPARQPFPAHSKQPASSMRDGSGSKPFAAAAAAASTRAAAAAAPGSPGARRTRQAGPTGHGAGPDLAAAAAFASIKAAVDSTAGGSPALHVRRLRGLGLMPEVPGSKHSPARQHAPRSPAVGGAAAAAAAAAQGSFPAHQQSWASTDDQQSCPASDSEGSWATVDDALEQEQLHAAQQAANEQHSERATDSTTTNPASSNAYDRSSGSSSPSPAKASGPQGQQDMQGGGGVPVAGGTPKMAKQDAERAASPISCESSLLGANLAARVPAEVVFSPVKIKRGVGGAAGCCDASPLRPVV